MYHTSGTKMVDPRWENVERPTKNNMEANWQTVEKELKNMNCTYVELKKKRAKNRKSKIPSYCPMCLRVRQGIGTCTYVGR